MTRFVPTLVFVLSTAAAAAAQTTPPQTPAPPQTPPAAAEKPAPPYKISGLVFGDYYSFLQHGDPKWNGQHGFWLRRVYLTYDHTLSPTLSMRLRLEMNSNGRLAGGLLNPYLKDAYVRWNFTGRQALTAGIQPTATWDYLETFWGLRHVEKTPLDLYRWDSARDLGVSLSGPLNSAQTVKYTLQYGNESGTGSETDAHKAFRAAARYEAAAGFTAEAVIAQLARASDADRTTAQVFAGYRAARGRAGVHYSYQRRRAVTGDTELDLISVFGVVDVKPKTLAAFVRLDHVADPCADCGAVDYLPLATTNPFTLTIAGVEYALHPSVRFSPNVEWTSYSDRSGAVTPKNGVAGRLTFYWSW